jgi:hypothetical protein
MIFFVYKFSCYDVPHEILWSFSWLHMDSNIHALSCFDDCMLIYFISLKAAINGWLHQYFESVVSMYEDRFELYVLSRRACDNPVDNQSERTNWFRLAFQKPSASNPMDYVCISPFSLPVRRTKELRALTGWYSLPLKSC